MKTKMNEKEKNERVNEFMTNISKVIVSDYFHIKRDKAIKKNILPIDRYDVCKNIFLQLRKSGFTIAESNLLINQCLKAIGEPNV